jgi:hypothetical protein
MVLVIEFPGLILKQGLEYHYHGFRGTGRVFFDSLHDLLCTGNNIAAKVMSKLSGIFISLLFVAGGFEQQAPFRIPAAVIQERARIGDLTTDIFLVFEEF